MKIDYRGKDFWKNYMVNWIGQELIEKWEKNVDVSQIDSVNGKLNVEVYKTSDLTKPTIVFSHGIAGSAVITVTPYFITVRF